MLVVLLVDLRLEGLQEVQCLAEIPLDQDFSEELDLLGMDLVLDLRGERGTLDYF